MLLLYSFIHTDRYAKSLVEHGAPKENTDSYRNTALNSLWDSIEKRCYTQVGLKDKQSSTTKGPILFDTCRNLKVNGKVGLTKGGPHHIAMGTTKGLEVKWPNHRDFFVNCLSRAEDINRKQKESKLHKYIHEQTSEWPARVNLEQEQ